MCASLSGRARTATVWVLRVLPGLEGRADPDLGARELARGTRAAHLFIWSLQLLESWGPVTTAPDATVRAMGEALGERRKRLQRAARGGGTGGPVFATVADAADRYQRGMITPVDPAAAAELVPRGLRPVQRDGGGGGWAWSWDDKWLLRSFLPPSEAQVLAMLGALACPVLMVSGAAGYEVARYSGARKRAELAARKRAIARLTEVILPAVGHYPHLDATSEVAALIQRFAEGLAAHAHVQARL